MPINEQEIFTVDGWKHNETKCEGCNGKCTWHLYEVDDKEDNGKWRKLRRMLYPIINVWESVVDKNTG